MPRFTLRENRTSAKASTLAWRKINPLTGYIQQLKGNLSTLGWRMDHDQISRSMAVSASLCCRHFQTGDCEWRGRPDGVAHTISR
jgi:hypothetical protein